MALGYLAEAHSVLEEFDKAAEALQFAASQPGASEENHLNLNQFYLRRFRAGLRGVAVHDHRLGLLLPASGPCLA